MKHYSISVMFSNRGIYTGKWETVSESVKARSAISAFRSAAVAYSNKRPLVTERPCPGVVVYEFSDVRFAVETA